MASGPVLVRARAARSRARARAADRVGDLALSGVSAAVSLLVVVVMVVIAYEVAHGASDAVSHFGLGFVGDVAWRPNFDEFGAAVMVFGTLVTSAMALLIAVPVGMAIGLYLALFAPRGVRGVVGPLVEMLAAVPSVILGLWGILVLGPFVRSQLEPWLHGTLGFLPVFGPPSTSGSSIFTAGLILAIMVLPIVASVSRDLFAGVPQEVQDGAAALGATTWEVVRGVVLPTSAGGVVAAAFLGLGRALGEAIAVTQVIGAGNVIHPSLFATGDTLASRIAAQFAGATSALHTSALFYLALLLLVIGLATNLLAQWIGRRFDQRRLLGS